MAIVVFDVTVDAYHRYWAWATTHRDGIQFAEVAFTRRGGLEVIDAPDGYNPAAHLGQVVFTVPDGAPSVAVFDTAPVRRAWMWCHCDGQPGFDGSPRFTRPGGTEPISKPDDLVLESEPLRLLFVVDDVGRRMKALPEPRHLVATRPTSLGRHG